MVWRGGAPGAGTPTGPNAANAKANFDRTSGSDTAIRNAERYVVGLATRLRVSSGQVTIAAVPYFDAAMVTPPKDRAAAFAKHMRKTIKTAFREMPEVPQTAPEPDVETPNLTVGAACAACRGLCCISGGKNNAFITPEVINRFRATDPAATADGVAAAYTASLPARIADGSCLYHGPKGCGLTRAMRSEVCNRYECGDLQAAPPVTNAPVAVVAHTHGTPWTVSLVTPEGKTTSQKLIDD